VGQAVTLCARIKTKEPQAFPPAVFFVCERTVFRLSSACVYKAGKEFPTNYVSVQKVPFTSYEAIKNTVYFS
jgi:hypothetical protein